MERERRGERNDKAGTSGEKKRRYEPTPGDVDEGVGEYCLLWKAGKDCRNRPCEYRHRCNVCEEDKGHKGKQEHGRIYFEKKKKFISKEADKRGKWRRKNERSDEDKKDRGKGGKQKNGKQRSREYRQVNWPKPGEMTPVRVEGLERAARGFPEERKLEYVLRGLKRGFRWIVRLDI